MRASQSAERVAKGRRLALLVLVGANVALMLALAGPVSVLADVVAPLTGHLVGMGLSASLALLVRRAVPQILAAGGALTVAVHVWLGLAGCCAAPQPTWQSPLAKVAHAPAESLAVLALNTWHRWGDAHRLERYLESAPAGNAFDQGEALRSPASTAHQHQKRQPSALCHTLRALGRTHQRTPLMLEACSEPPAAPQPA